MGSHLHSIAPLVLQHRKVFAPTYRDIAGWIIARTGVTRGICLDIGCGAGYLGAAMARASGLLVLLFDRSPDMLTVARRTFCERGLQMRAATLQGEVSAIALPDACIDLAVCRSSVYFENDMVRALREIHRVLAPGGMACIGGGSGLPTSNGMSRGKPADRRFETDRQCNSDTCLTRLVDTAFGPAGIEAVSIQHSDHIGPWFVVQKSATCNRPNKLIIQPFRIRKEHDFRERI